jgi:pyrroline-5-carboxylate reductase
MFLILDALADGAVKMGMSRQLALRLAAHTMLGSASLAIETSDCFSNGKHIMQIKEEVCSPGGTSIYGIAELENYRVRSALIRCIEVATIRSKELNNQGE